MVLEASAGPLEIRVDAEADALHFIGQASIGHGYPMMGEREEAARYEIVFDDGEIQTVSLRNGVEFASAFGLLGPSRIDPRASRAMRVLTIRYDTDWEVYHLNRLRVELPSRRHIACIRAVPLLKDYALLLYGITAECRSEHT